MPGSGGDPSSLTTALKRKQRKVAQRLEQLQQGWSSREYSGMEALHTLMTDTAPINPPFRLANAIAARSLTGQPALMVELTRDQRDVPGSLAYQANAWADAGVDALAVLADEYYTADGEADTREVARAAPNLPILSVDWTLHPVQIVDAMRAGAHAVQLVTAVLTAKGVATTQALVRPGGVDTVVEICNDDDRRAAEEAGTVLFGINLTVGLNLKGIPGAKESVTRSLLSSLPLGTYSIVGASTFDAVRRAKWDGADCIILQRAMFEEGGAFQGQRPADVVSSLQDVLNGDD